MFVNAMIKIPTSNIQLIYFNKWISSL